MTHVDASKGMVERAKENARLNGITTIRYIVDDCQKFIEREIRRGNFYDAIIMDPPSYGRGTNGEMWKLENNLYDFVQLSKKFYQTILYLSLFRLIQQGCNQVCFQIF